MFISPRMLLIATAILLTVLHMPALLNTEKYKKAMKELTGEKNLIRIMGLLMLILSFIYLSVHWKFTGGWFILIPILGWGTLLKGITWIWHPEFVSKMIKKVVLRSDNTAGLVGFLTMIAAIGLLYVGIYLY